MGGPHSAIHSRDFLQPGMYSDDPTKIYIGQEVMQKEDEIVLLEPLVKRFDLLAVLENFFIQTTLARIRVGEN